MIAGAVVGTLDITYACLFWALRARVPPERIFQSVAAGLLGRASYEGGFATAALGLVLHYFIATSMSVAYFIASRRWRSFNERPFISGAAYGLMLYGFMNFIVVPLSAAGGGGPKDSVWIALSILVHMLLIGYPLALFARHAYGPEP